MDCVCILSLAPPFTACKYVKLLHAWLILASRLFEKNVCGTFLFVKEGQVISIISASDYTNVLHFEIVTVLDVGNDRVVHS